MKIFSARKNPDANPLDIARGCMASNLTVPGLGSLAGARKVGFVQLPLYLTGFVITIGFGSRFVYWTLANWVELHSPDTDPIRSILEMLQQAFWPFVGVAMFVISWLWALLTSRSLLAEAKNKKPPQLT